jgi:hypothetical protein
VIDLGKVTLPIADAIHRQAQAYRGAERQKQ